MTANAGKGADGRSGEPSTGEGGKKDQRKKTSAAGKPPGDEVTVKKTDPAPDDTESADEAEETVIDFTGKKTGHEDTVQDIKPSGAPDKSADAEKLVTDPTGDAVGSKDRLVSRGAQNPAKNTSKTGQTSSTSGRTAAMDTSISAPAYDGPAATPSYGAAEKTALEPASGPGDSSRGADKAGGRKAPRKAHLQVARFEPWSVMKFSFIMSLVCFLVLFVAVAVLYLILSGLGVFDALSSTVRDLQGKSSGGLNPASWFSAARILGYTALIGTLNVLLITALATVWSVIYNMAADLVGGIEITLKEADQ